MNKSTHKKQQLKLGQVNQENNKNFHN